jgi:hypothetical protein
LLLFVLLLLLGLLSLLLLALECRYPLIFAH